MLPQKLRLTNDRVDPSILTLCLLTDSNRKFSKVLFLDPEDGNAWADEDLTPLEKGLVFQHFTDRDSKVHVHMPYRVMDKVVASWLKEFKSLQSETPFVSMHRTAAQSRKNIKSCLQDFSLSSSEFKKFQKKISSVNWIIESSSVSKDDLIDLIENICTIGRTCIEKIQLLKKAEVSLENLDEVLTEVEILSSEIMKIKNSRVTFTKEISRLDLEINRDKDRALVDVSFNRLVSIIAKIDEDHPKNLYYYFTQVAQSENTASYPVWVNSLEKEFQNLEKYFPVLKHLKASGRDIVIDLAGVKITLTDDSVRIDGDITALKPYVTVDGVVTNSGRRRRFSNILMTSEIDKG